MFLFCFYRCYCTNWSHILERQHMCRKMHVHPRRPTVCQPALLFFPNLSTEFTCQTVPKRTCTISGDPHYYTFDGTVFHFQGTCTYIISEVELNSSLPYYRVEAKNENRGSTRVSWTELVKVFVYNYTIELVKGQQGKAKVSNFDSGYNSIEVLMQAIVYTMHKHILP